MLKKIFVILAVLGLMIPSFAFAQYGLDTASKGTGLIKGGSSIDAQKAVPELIGDIVGVALSFVGAIFFLLILYAGFLWMTAFGAADKVDKAKSILEHAAVGLLIVLAAYAISRFVFSSLTAVTTATPTGQADPIGCCYLTDKTSCDPNILKSKCDITPGPAGLSWKEGSCPADCLFVSPI